MKKLLLTAIAAGSIFTAIQAAPTEFQCKMTPEGAVHPVGTTFTFTGKVIKGDDIPENAILIMEEFVSGMRRKDIHIKFGEEQKITRKVTSPGCYSVHFRIATPNRRTIGRHVHGVGAMVSPEKIRAAVPRPADFEAFWQTQRQLLDNAPIKELARQELAVPDKWAKQVACYDVKVSCPTARPLTGILTMPKTAAPKSLPAIVFYHGAGVRSAMPMYVYGRVAIALDVNTHGLENNQDSGFYQGYHTGELKHYWWQNKDDRNKYAFREIFIRAMRAVDYVKSLPEWNGKVLIVRGGSQGGALATVAAAMDQQVTMLFAEVPALADHGAFTARISRVSGWPILYNPRRDTPQVLECAKYYDIANFAPMVKCPTYFSAGMCDHTCEAASIAAAWNALPESSKAKIEYHPRGNHSTAQLSSESKKKIFAHFND